MLKHRNEISIVNDQLGSPTWCRAIASGVGLVLSQKRAYEPELSGYYNMTCEGKSTWYEFAVLISKYYEARTNRRVTIYPVSTGIYPMGAKRPKYSILDNTKLNNTFKMTLPDWQICLKLVMQDMGYTEPANYSIYPRIFRKHSKDETL
jgi:dTDP-4-dehydrorhamnose reductase